jgi:hypothetical protein
MVAGAELFVPADAREDLAPQFLGSLEISDRS